MTFLGALGIGGADRPPCKYMSTQLALSSPLFDPWPTELLSVIDSLSEGIVIADTQGVIRRVNLAFAQMTGYERQDIIGRRIFEIYFPPGSAEAENEARQMFERYAARRAGKSELYETLIFRRDGARRWIQTNASPLYDAAGEIIGSIGTLSDITEKKLLEQELRWSQKMEAVGRLAGGVAHDFNNLLTVIQGYVELLSQELDHDDPHRRKIQIIQEASEAAALLTQQLLSISRRHVVRVEPISISEVIESSLRVIQGITGERVRLVADLMQKPPLVSGDRSQLQQVLLNLVVNARDAMPDGGTLVIETTAVDAAGNELDRNHLGADGTFVRLRVEDTGIGMSEDVKARIFEPFFTTKSQTLGSGLGLAVTHGIVEQHNGSIAVTTAPNQGSTFDVMFPALPCPEVRPAPEHPTESLDGFEVVLVVEDNIAVRVMLCEALDRYGYTVLQAKDGAKAMEIVRSLTDRSIDLLITDLVMPGISGTELAEQVVAHSPNTKVLVISGCADEGAAAGDDGSLRYPFLEKPFTPETVARATRRALDGRAAVFPGRP